MEREIISFANPAEFEAWLKENHTRTSGIWILHAKKGSERPSITYAEAVQCALCFGWIDGQKAKYDEQSWLQYFVKRKKNSIWSQINQKHVERLILEGRIQAPGLEAVEEAKRSGQWAAAYQPVSSREIPAELAKALADSPKAKAFFETLNSQNRFAFVFRVSSPKKEETRLKKVAECIRMLENGEMFYPQKEK